MFDALGVKGTGAPDNPVDEVTLGEEELGEVRAVLAGDSGNKGDFSWVGRHEEVIVSGVSRPWFVALRVAGGRGGGK